MLKSVLYPVARRYAVLAVALVLAVLIAVPATSPPASAAAGPALQMVFSGPRAQGGRFNVAQGAMPDVNGTDTQGIKASDLTTGQTEPFTGSIAYRNLSSPAPGVAPYAASSQSHQGFASLAGVGQGDLRFDFDGLVIQALGAAQDITGGPQVPFDDPRFDVLDSLYYFISDDGRNMEKRTYMNGTFSIIDVGGGGTVATGTVPFITLFLDYSTFQNFGSGEAVFSPGSAMYDDIVARTGQAKLTLTISSFQSPVFEDNPVGDPLIDRYAVFATSLTATEPTFNALDFGDAPDPGFPSLKASDGIRHVDAAAAFLGDNADTEADAHVPDADQFDDGVVSWDPLQVKVTNNSVAGSLFLNVLVDAGGDGAWGPGDWLIQDHQLNIPQGQSRTIKFALSPPEDVWVRISLTDRRIAIVGILQLEDPWDGSFPFPFQVGETEDYRVPGAEQRLARGDSAGGNFGWSVAIDGDTAIVGAPFGQEGGAATGLAYVFRQVGSTNAWNLEAKLVAGDPDVGDSFGVSVAVDGDTVVVGAPGDDAAGDAAGAAYVFVRSGGAWNQQQKLTAGDAANADVFGEAVAISGDTVVVGARQDDDGGDNSGSAYVFLRSGAVWTQQAKLAASDAAADDEFGTSVAIDADTAIIGAPADSDAGADSGSAYVFLRTGAAWNQQQKLTAADAAAGDEFGHSVSIDVDSADIGARALADTGYNYVYGRSGAVWSQQQKLVASDGAVGDDFGFAVSVDADTLISGAPADDDAGSASGAAYLFRPNSPFTQRSKLTAGGAAAGDKFGWSADVSGDHAIVGAPFDADDGANSGAAYVFSIAASSSVLSGTLSLQGVTSTTTLAAIGPVVTIVPQGGGATSSPTVQPDGTFSVPDVAPGTYTVTAMAAGYVARQRQNVVVAGSSVTLPTVELRAGLVDGNAAVNIHDITAVIASFGATPPDRLDGSGRVVDLNADGVVDVTDMSLVISNFGATSPQAWP